MTNSKTLKDLLFLCGMAAVFLLAGLGSGSLASWDEANYAVVSKAIAATGDWVVFRWPGGGFFFDKPPLYFWLTAFFYKIFGVGEWATRLPSALGGIGLVAVTYLLGARLYGRWAGVAGAGVMLSSTDFIRYARFGTMDILQLFFFAAAILAYLGTRERAARWWWFWAASAGCFMTKGPLVFLAWGIIAVHFVWERRWRTLTAPQFWLGIVLFAAIVAPWHVAAFQSNPDAFWREYVVKNYITRGSQALDGHEGNAYFYIRVLINKYHPWILLVPVALALAARRLWTSAEKSRDVLLLTWIAVVLAFFTFGVKTKLNWYILPLHPALSLLVGVCLAESFAKRRKWIKPGLFIAVALQVPFSGVYGADHTAGVRRLAPVVQSRVPAFDTVHLYNYHEQPAALFYWDRGADYVDTMKDLAAVLRKEKNSWLVVPAREFEPRIREFTRLGLHVVVRADVPKEKLYLLETR